MTLVSRKFTELTITFERFVRRFNKVTNILYSVYLFTNKYLN